MAKNYDVIIIGAGPAGIFTALEIADTGLSVLILEKGLDIRSYRFEQEQDGAGERQARKYCLRLGRSGGFL